MSRRVISHNNSEKKLHIWDKAKREAAQRRKSDWRDNLGGWNSAPSDAT